jgi:arylsulfatase A-like enzyme
MKAISLLAVTLLNSVALFGQNTTGEAKKPNIVFILMDNLGYVELGCYGGGILRGAPTPRIDKLAIEGTRLLNFNVEAQCTPSRSAIMTGRALKLVSEKKVTSTNMSSRLVDAKATMARLISATSDSICFAIRQSPSR